MTSPDAEAGRFRRAVFLGGLLLAAAVCVAGRLHTMEEPLDIDIATYAVVAREALAGRELYSDLWDHKPPGLHLAFALAQLVAGPHELSVLLVGCATALLTLLAVVRVLSDALGSRPAALWGGLLWSALSLNLPLGANQPNAEALLNPCVAWGLWAALRLARADARWGHALLFGGCAAAASLVKHVGVLPFVTMAAALSVLSRGDGPRFRRTLGRLAAGLALVPLAWAAVLGWFAADGRFSDAWDALIVYNAWYAGAGDGGLVALDLAFLLPPLLSILPSTVTLLVRGEARGAGSAPHAVFLAAVAGTALAVDLPGRWVPHYLQLWLPLLSVALGLAVAELSRALPAPRRIRAHVLAAVVVLPVAASHAAPFRLPPFEWSRVKWARLGARFDLAYLAGAYADGLLAPGETFYMYGNETQLYFVSGRRPPSGVLYALPLAPGSPLRDGLLDRLRRQLAADPPELVVVARYHLPDIDAGRGPAGPELERWLFAGYRQLPRVEGLAHDLFARKGGRLEARVAARGGLLPPVPGVRPGPAPEALP